MQYRQLVVWQRAMDLAELIYRITRLLPPDERFGLVRQTRNSARSVPANIAEGYGRARTRDHRRFLGIATGSLLERESDLELIARLRLLPELDLQRVRALASEVGGLLAGLRRSLRRESARLGGPDA